MDRTRTATLSFTVEMNEQTIFEIEQKGWFEQVRVNLPDGRSIPVCFWDPVRLAQDLETELRLGKRYLAEPGMIVIPCVTVENMKAAVEDLFQLGYFDHFK